MINKLRKNPGSLFVVDGIGAFLSATVLGIIFIKFNDLIGMPRNALIVLAIMPCFFMLFDIISYFQSLKKSGVLLKTISIINLGYCCISLGFVFYHFDKITVPGLTYFMLESVIVVGLAIIEFKTANHLVLH